jgi:predicted dehydrogenase
LSQELLSADVEQLIAKSTPDVIASFGPTTSQLPVVRAAIAKKIPVMLEKPMGASLAEAIEIERLSRESGVPVFVNYETTWYPNTQFLFSPGGQAFVGALKKVVVRSGHRGPLELGVHPEFLSWLTNPEQGGGALLDFGCYGVQFLTRLFQGTKALAVTAITQKLKTHPAYSKVEDEATLIIEYPGAQGIVQASWNWPVDRKDWEVYGDFRSLTSQGRNDYTFKESSGNSWSGTAPWPTGADVDPLAYIQALVGSGGSPSQATIDLGSPWINLEVSRILEAAKISAQQGKRINL